jgi:hypothetical protein
MGRKKKDTKCQGFIKEELVVSPISIKRNKINMKLGFNYKRKEVRVKIYPIWNLDREIRIKNIAGKKICKINHRKINIKFINEKSREKRVFINKNHNKISKMSKSVFQVIGVDEKLTRLHFSLGNIVKLKYKNKTKIVLMTYLDNLKEIYDGSENLYFYCTNNKQNHFLNFFEGLLKFDSDSMKKEYFLLGQRFGLINLELNNLYLNLLKNSDFSMNEFLMIFEVSSNILEVVDYGSIPIINLDCERNSALDTNNSFFSFTLPLNYKNDQKITNFYKNLLLDNLVKYDNLSICFGDVLINKNLRPNGKDYLCGFNTCTEYGNVGSLIYSLDRCPQVMGINVGMVNKNNCLISFGEEKVIEFLRNYLVLSLENILSIQ